MSLIAELMIGYLLIIVLITMVIATKQGIKYIRSKISNVNTTTDELLHDNNCLNSLVDEKDECVNVAGPEPRNPKPSYNPFDSNNNF